MTLSRPVVVLVSVTAGLYFLLIPAFVMQRSAVKEVASSKSKYKELLALSGEYRILKEQVDIVEQKGITGQSGGIVNAFDGITSSMGVKGKVKSIKGIGSREMKGSMIEEGAEVRLEKLSMNELVNLFYKIGEAPMILSIKKTQIKKSFENPELLDVTLSISLFTKK